MDGKMSWMCKILVLQIVIISPTGCMCLPKPANETPPELASVSVTGMVKNPGKLAISSGGLTLRDAIAFAGGDNPLTSFDISPIFMLVSLDRTEAIYSFSLPLVIGDDAGKIFLQAGDKVSVQPWYETDLSRFSRNLGIGTDKAKFEADPNPEGVLPILGISNPNQKKVDFKIVASEFGTKVREQRLSYDWTPDLPEPTIKKLTLQQFTTNKDQFPIYSQSQTVLVLKRIQHGRLLEFVLLRTNPRTISARTVSSLGTNQMTDVLSAIVIAPNDNLSIDTLQRQPIVLSSLLAPYLSARARQKDKQECLPKVQETWQDTKDVVHTILAPAGQALNQMNGIVSPPLQLIGGSLLAPFKR